MWTSLAGLTIRPRVPEDDEASVAVNNRLSPEFPPTTVKELRDQIDLLPPPVKRDIVTAELDGVVVANSLLLEMFWVVPPGPYLVDVNIDPDHWGKGIGSRLYERIQQKVDEFGPTRLYTNVREDRPNAFQFAEERGFVRTDRVTRNSRLEVKSANREGYNGLEERLATEGIRVRSVAELGGGEDALRIYHHLQESAGADEPSSEEFALSFEQWRDTFLKQGNISYDAMWIAFHDEQGIGSTMLYTREGRAANSGGMGVERAYRGRGVARLLKIKTVDWALEHDVDYLYTGNDVENPRMLAINVRLGYKALPGTVEMVKELASPS